MGLFIGIAIVVLAYAIGDMLSSLPKALESRTNGEIQKQINALAYDLEQASKRI